MRRRDFIARGVPAAVLVSYGGLPAFAPAHAGTIDAFGEQRNVADGHAFRYIGVPYPTDPVPAAIMPTLPNGADYNNHEWINTYDPVSEPNPAAPSQATRDVYVVNRFSGNATDNDQGDNAVGGTVYGTTDRPRVTLPEAGTFPAGTRIFVYGDNTPLPNSESNNRKVDYSQWGGQAETIRFNGTSGSPCWIIGVDRPRLRADNLQLVDSNHVIFDGIYLESANGASGDIEIETSNYVCFRNGGLYGEETSRGGNMFEPTGNSSNALTTFVVFYNNEVAYAGDYNEAPGGDKPNDFHGFRPQDWCRWLWCIGNEFHHLSGDACQVNNSNESSSDHAKRPHYVYFAGNVAYRLKENMFDAKNCYHAIVSQNFSRETEEDAMIVPNNSEGPLSSYHWAIANIITQSGSYGRGGGIRAANDLGNAYSAVIGNFIYDIDGVALQIANQTNGNVNKNYFVNNTVARCSTGFRINVWQPAGSGWNIDFHSNVIYNCDTDVTISDAGNGNIDVDFADNLMYNASRSSPRIDNRGDITNERRTLTNNPGFNNPSATTPDGFVPQSPASALDNTEEHPVYADFQNLYGIDIREDLLGNRRAQGGQWDIGAVEFTGVRPQ
ncbi:MAG: hypothetical protein AAF004_15220, partial [Pseudomonadota bacterium]